MKKLLIILLTAAAFACQDGKKSEKDNAGTNEEQTDESAGEETVAPDTTDQTENAGDTTATPTPGVQ